MPPKPMSIYPTYRTLEEVIALANSKIPIGNKNEVYAILMTFQNTLLKVIDENQ